MAKPFKTAGAIYILGIMVFALLFHTAQSQLRSSPETAAQQAAQSAQKTAQVIAPDGHILLFPNLNTDAITAISVNTADRSFQFHRDGRGDISVNGQQADSEIYMTLVNQISELPVNTSAAFSPDNTQLILTLTVFENGEQHTARFYEDSGTGEIARIVAGPADAPEYSQTNGWRVGTLMLTCEGAPIQDERISDVVSDI